MADVSTITANGVTYDIKDTVARAGMENILTISVGTFTSLPTIQDARITSDHVMLECVFTNPSAILSAVGWATSNGQLVLSGSMSGSSQAYIVLGKSVF